METDEARMAISASTERAKVCAAVMAWLVLAVTVWVCVAGGLAGMYLALQHTWDIHLGPLHLLVWPKP